MTLTNKQTLRKLFLFIVIMLTANTIMGQIVTDLTSNFSTGFDGWTRVNGSVRNQWHRGTAPSNMSQTGTTHAIYISNNNGTSNTQFADRVVVHFYRDVTIPSGATNIKLEFMLKVNGSEPHWLGYSGDWLRVHAAPTSVIPTVGDGSGHRDHMNNLIQYRIGDEYYCNIPNWSNIVISSSSLSSGSTRRIIFSWISDQTLPENPPAAITNIKITYDLPVMLTFG